MFVDQWCLLRKLTTNTGRESALKANYEHGKRVCTECEHGKRVCTKCEHGKRVCTEN